MKGKILLDNIKNLTPENGVHYLNYWSQFGKITWDISEENGKYICEERLFPPQDPIDAYYYILKIIEFAKELDMQEYVLLRKLERS